MQRIEQIKNITKDDLQRKYQELRSLRKVGDFYGTDHSVVKRMMNRFGLTYNSKYKHNLSVMDDFFSVPSKINCYWAGFLAADGCIHGKYVKLSLAEKDLDHLTRFRNDVCSKHKISKSVSGTGSICYTLDFTSNQMVQDLKTFGVIERKIKILTFPSHIPKEFMPSFCRGYFDGDGCWCLHKPSSRKNRKPQIVFSTRGTEQFLNEMNKVMVEQADLPKRCLEKSLRGWRTSVLQYNGNLICSKIAQWLYSDIDDGRYLLRKMHIVQTALGHTHKILL